MIFGISGHQERPGIDWHWVRTVIDDELDSHRKFLSGFSSLASGADQVFAEAIIDRGGLLTAVIPKSHYEEYFSGESLIRYKSILAKSRVVSLDSNELEDEDAFLKAGLYILYNCDCLIAVWDGKKSRGKGGTADIVQKAFDLSKPIIHIEPISREVIYHNI